MNLSENIEENEKLPWLKWEENSCRYDSFLTVFSLGLYKNFDEFDQSRADKRHKHKKIYSTLCDVAQQLEKADSFTKRRPVIDNFWDYLHKLKIDENKRGEMGCVQELLVTLLPLLHLQPFIEEERKCDGCGLNETNRIRLPLP